jgi:hypothetical protein
MKTRNVLLPLLHLSTMTSSKENERKERSFRTVFFRFLKQDPFYLINEQIQMKVINTLNEFIQRVNQTKKV